MKEYTVTITERTKKGEEKVFEFYSDDKNVMYKLDKEAYENGKKLLSKALDYMNDVKVDKTVQA